MNSEVFINGHSLGVRPYGYVSFSYDLTPHIKWGGKNVVAVRVDNAEQPIPAGIRDVASTVRYGLRNLTPCI